MAKEAELVPKIMVDYLSSLVKSNADWQIAMKEAYERRTQELREIEQRKTRIRNADSE